VVRRPCGYIGGMGGTSSAVARASAAGVALAGTVLVGAGCAGAEAGDRAAAGNPPVDAPSASLPHRPADSVDPTRDITDLTPSTRGLRLAKPVNGVRHGELVLTIRNNGPAPVPRLMFTVELPESMSADGGDWAGCSPLASMKPGFPAGSKCDKGNLDVGQSRSFRLGVKSPAAQDGNDSRVSRWLTDVWSAGERDEYCQDAAPEDNRKIFSVYRD
jgi:hypothetical protein